MNSPPLTRTLLKEIGFTLLAEGRTIRVKADGCSMYPAIKPGAVIFIEPREKNAEFSAGEIIAWKRDSGLVVHRLIRITETGGRLLYVTRGDSSITEDEPVTAGEIAGRVVRIEWPGGKTAGIPRHNLHPFQYKLNRTRVLLYLYMKKFRTILSNERKDKAL